MYFALKHIHLLAVALSALILTTHFLLTVFKSSLAEAKGFKFLPHIFYTLILLTAIGLCWQLGQYPLVHDWVTGKLIAYVAYALMASMSLKFARNNTMRVIGFLGAWAWLGLAAKIAITKMSLF